MSLTIDWHGQELHLLPEGVIFWPAQSILLVADLHLGKDATFRNSGIPIPPGSDEDTLRRLDTLLEKIQPKRLAILGDLFHGSGSKTEIFARWPVSKGIEIDLVVGNHDRWVKLLDLGVACHLSIEIEGIILSHAPLQSSNPVICGHIHPGYRLESRGHRTEKLKCFWQRQTCLVLPAFGAFTGNFWIRPEKEDQLFLLAGSKVVAFSK